MTSLQDKKTPGNALISFYSGQRGHLQDAVGQRSPEWLPLPLRDDWGGGGKGGSCQKQESSVLFCFFSKTKQYQ